MNIYTVNIWNLKYFGHLWNLLFTSIQHMYQYYVVNILFIVLTLYRTSSIAPWLPADLNCSWGTSYNVQYRWSWWCYKTTHLSLNSIPLLMVYWVWITCTSFWTWINIGISLLVNYFYHDSFPCYQNIWALLWHSTYTHSFTVNTIFRK